MPQNGGRDTDNPILVSDRGACRQMQHRKYRQSASQKLLLILRSPSNPFHAIRTDDGPVSEIPTAKWLSGKVPIGIASQII